MPGAAKLLTAGGGAVNLQPASSISSDVTVELPVVAQRLIGNKTPGTVLQVVSATVTSNFDTTSTSFVDVTGLSVSITPSSATSKILVTVSGGRFGLYSAGSYYAGAQILRNSTILAVVEYLSTRDTGGNASGCAALEALDSPGTTSALTYKCQAKSSSSSGNVNVCNGANNITITAMEIAA